MCALEFSRQTSKFMSCSYQEYSENYGFSCPFSLYKSIDAACPNFRIILNSIGFGALARPTDRREALLMVHCSNK